VVQRVPFGPALFRFDDPQQQRIYEELRELIGPGLAAFFRDACWMMANPWVLGTTAHLVAHCLREVDSALREVLKPIVIEQESADTDMACSGDSHKHQIRLILRSLGIAEDAREGQAWLKLAGELNRWAHRRALDPPRSPEELRDLWDSAQDWLAAILPAIRSKFLGWLSILDQLLTVKRPRGEHVKRLASEVPNNVVVRRYFFNRLENPEWLEPLRKRGFFRHPPEPERNDEEGAVRFPPWPETRYLARMARLRPEVVCRIILEIPDTGNVIVYSDLVDGALALPPDISAQLVEKVTKWAETPYFLLPEKLGQLMAYWARGGKIEQAICLARVLLRCYRTNGYGLQALEIFTHCLLSPGRASTRGSTGRSFKRTTRNLCGRPVSPPWKCCVTFWKRPSVSLAVGMRVKDQRITRIFGVQPSRTIRRTWGIRSRTCSLRGSAML
jgi:hypothetical protein